ncbi:RDD family protein [Lysinibacter cavernae]|uniref:FHA domain-containing protein n=1 Tax=Lysinibacter cavernae TaxID=1640652 RepID=A0A7X5TUU6_9MICO|nr:RDD family protein [Lysinibacter cavernae]NIH53977.1 hypothetical protein [Lysinibacter cavernae]
MTNMQQSYVAAGPVAESHSRASCGQQLASTMAFCIMCGATQHRQGTVSYAQTAAAPAQFVSAAPLSAPRTSGGLTDAFGSLRPATTGARLAAFTVDVLSVLLLAALVWFGSAAFFGEANVVYTVLAAGELAVGLWVWQATRGATIGNVLLRIRVTRAEHPLAMGAARAAGRAAVTLAGGLIAGIGSWVIVASSAWDASGRRRGWQDKAARTQSVFLPPRRKIVAGRTVISDPVYHYMEPSQQLQAGLGSFAAPTVSSTRTNTASAPGAAGSNARRQNSEALEESAGVGESFGSLMPGVHFESSRGQSARASRPGHEAEYETFGTQRGSAPYSETEGSALEHSNTNRMVPPVPGQPLLPVSAEPEPFVVPDLFSARAEPAPEGEPVLEQELVVLDARVTSLLLTFDTGQQLYLVSPGTGLIGRNPRQRYETDQVFSVEDPDSTLSKAHIEFEANGEVLRIMDNNSTNGTDITYADGSLVSVVPGELFEVPPGATVRLGDRAFNVHPIWE